MSGISRILKEREKIEDEITDHKHTHIQTGNSHWHLRVCHCPLTQHPSWPLLAKPNNIESMWIWNIDKASNKSHNSYLEFDMQGTKTVM